MGTGLKDLSEGFGKLAKSTQLASIAQKAYNGVQIAFNAIMALNPLGILIISLTAVTALVFTFKDKILDLIKTALGPFKGIIDTIAGAFTSLAEKIGLVDDAQTKLTKSTIKSYEKQIALAEAAGEKTLELQQKRLQEELKLLEKGTDEYEANLLQQQILDIKINKDKQDAQDAADKLAEEKRKANRAKIAEEKKKVQEQDAKDAEEKKKKDEEDLAKERKRQEDILSIQEEYRQRQNDINAETEVQKVNLEEERKLIDLEKLNATEEEKQSIRDFYSLRRTEAELSDAQTRADNQKKIDDIEAQNVVKQEQVKANAIANGIGALNALAGQSKEIAIAAVIASQAQSISEIISNTGIANAKAVAAFPLTLGQPFVGINTVSAVASVAGSLLGARKSIQQIKSAGSGGGTPSGGVTIPGRRGGGGSPNVSAPQSESNQSAVSPLDIAEQQSKNQAPIMAYTLSGNVRNAQEADAKIKSKRSVG